MGRGARLGTLLMRSVGITPGILLYMEPGSVTWVIRASRGLYAVISCCPEFSLVAGPIQVSRGSSYCIILNANIGLSARAILLRLSFFYSTRRSPFISYIMLI
jgi:hypothetical protein